MAEAALFIGWGEAVRGRAKASLDFFNESMQFWQRLQDEGRIERFDLVFLRPHGGDLSGFVLMRGTAQQIDSLKRADDVMQSMERARLRVEGFGVVNAFVDEGIARGMAHYVNAVEELE